MLYDIPGDRNLSEFNSDYIVLNDSMTVINELQRMWKEMVMVQFKVLSWNCPGDTEGNHRNISWDYWCPSQEYHWPNQDSN
jgi:hypothetical protein